jgi:hypothetical protein
VIQPTSRPPPSRRHRHRRGSSSSPSSRYDRSAKTGEPKAAGSRYAFVKEDRRVTVYYFYIADAEFGLGFIKLCAYFPYPGKVWTNGHAWAKRQALAEGLAFTELANGFASCADPARLQTICDRLGPADLQAFFDRWMRIIPHH